MLVEYKVMHVSATSHQRVLEQLLSVGWVIVASNGYGGGGFLGSSPGVLFVLRKNCE